MESSLLQPPQNAGTKSRAIQQAKEMEMLVAERAKRSGDEPPPYGFSELIGKGSYGRVFKGINPATGGLVAIKIIDIDKVDYEEMTTKNLEETLKEIRILQQLRDSKARPYVNIIEEARTVHNELWIISEYCSGGSVHTLMKPTMTLQNPGLDEKYIIAIARELALGLKYIHEAGVLHRDLKCNNILVNEEGRVQLCDFGVSGQLEPEIAKRSTIVGTPYWMAPELQKEWVKDADPSSMVRPNEVLYGSEVDIWAYGCTVFEMATGFPPFHKTVQWKLPESGIPQLEGARFSDNLKSLVAFVLAPNPQDRPTSDQILEHPFLANTTKMYPSYILVQLVERYYRWEQGGGARASLFNPYGAQAPDPLAPEIEDDEDDWTFSTTDDFERQIGGQFPDPFSGSPSGQNFMSAPPPDDDRFAKLQASIKEEQIKRGKRRLDRVFDQNSTPYRYSGVGSDRPPSDLVLRDFNPGAPNRETVIDLDFAAPSVADVPSIDLGEVPTLKANRMHRLLRETELEEEEEGHDSFSQNQLTKRATRDWKFPVMAEDPMPAKPIPEKPNRRTMEWTFDASMAEANYEPLPKELRFSRRRETQELTVPMMTAPLEDNRRTRDFVFPPREPAESQSSMSDQGPVFASSPTLGPDFRPSLRHATTEPVGSFDDYPRIISAPDSPLRTSMIDLDMANIDDYRPSTADSASTSTYTAGTEATNGNPFDLEDQVHLSQNNNRASYHMKSQSEPNHAIPGLLTPNAYDEQEYPTEQGHPHSMHARGVSSVSQMQVKPPPNNMGYSRQRSQQVVWDSWSHQAAYNIDESPPASVSTSGSAEDEDSVDELWEQYERQAQQSQRRLYDRGPSSMRSRRTASTDDDLARSSDADAEEYADDNDGLAFQRPATRTSTLISRVSVGPNGKPLVDFPVPRGPDPEALVGVESDPIILSNALWKSTTELRDGLRASRDLLKAMRLEEMKPPGMGMEGLSEEEGDGEGQGTVRVAK
ncbi:kinase-like protein [Lindgomyces ingoldianus]|uniref:Kinase-like protein n=1 Tax=Lindgomyces ingoldianus TaxID=673940 RepID=A0ACB6QBT8_9PLEO|nr:kinase-like protein [Lindgomyces ingoldianus]KAF2464063.1 kinase-like protein [Lindgomyces ingoldianus]